MDLGGIGGQDLSCHPMSVADSWIAATAIRHKLPIVTHNKKHFEHVPGLSIISAS
jgi:tRNA(fMet)-specific endonuclease VapC